MKLSISHNSWRLRAEEQELQQLLDGNSIELACHLDANLGLQFRLNLHEAGAEVRQQENVWQISLPKAELAALKARLPSREGVSFRLAAAGNFTLVFEVDVRDSLERRDGRSRRHL